MKTESTRGHFPELPGVLFPGIPRVLPEIQHEATGRPLKGSQSVNKSTERTWPWPTDGLSQRHIPVESTIHFTLRAHTHAHMLNHTHAYTRIHTHTVTSLPLFSLEHFTGVPGLYHPLYPDRITPLLSDPDHSHSVCLTHLHMHTALPSFCSPSVLTLLSKYKHVMI